MNIEQTGGVIVRDTGSVDLDLGAASKVLWQRWWIILGNALAFGIAFFILAIVLPKKYTAWTLVSVAAAQRSGGGGLSALSQFSGIAQLAGVSLPGNKYAAARVALLKSRAAIASFIERENLLPVLFPKKWDSRMSRWRPGVRVPTLYDGVRYFQRHILTVIDDESSGLITVRIEWSNPKTAAKWTNEFVRGVNDFAQKKAITRAKRHLQFLNARSQTERYISQQEAIARLTENQLRQEMIASGSEQYAFTVIDPAMVPEKPTFPKRSLFSVLGVMLGSVFGVACVFLGVRRRRLRATGSGGQKAADQ